MVIVNEVAELLPYWSSDVKETVVVPTEKEDPGRCDATTNGGGPQLSVAAGAIHVIVVLQAPASADPVILSGVPTI